MIRRITPEEEYNAGLVIFRQGGVHPLEDENGFLPLRPAQGLFFSETFREGGK